MRNSKMFGVKIVGSKGIEIETVLIWSTQQISSKFDVKFAMKFLIQLQTVLWNEEVNTMMI